MDPAIYQNLSGTSNNTLLTDNRATEWNFSLLWTLIICILVVTLNGFILTLFLSDERLRSQPFNLYLMQLLILNIVYAVLQNPLDIINHKYPVWWLGEHWCNVYLFAQSIVSACVMHTHVLVTISRLWAMTFPLTFQRRHSRQTVFMLCGGMLTYVNIIMLPEFIALMLHRPPLVGPCSLTFKWGYSAYVRVLIFAMPETIILTAYPVIYYLRRKRALARAHRVAPAASGVQSQGRSNGGSVESIRTGKNAVGNKKKSLGNRSYAFTILTLLTCSVFICWTPVNVCFMISTFRPVPYPALFQTVLTLFGVHPVLDPLLFTIAMQDLRTAFYRMFGLTVATQ